MSSPGSDALTLEIRSPLLADRVTVGLIVASAVAIEAVAARHPDARLGLGIAAGALLGLWYRLWVRRRPTLLGAALDGVGKWQLRLSDGQVVPAVLQPGSRILGPSVFLRWKTGRRAHSAWLTSLDVGAARLRELSVRLVASDARAGA
jgi:hypothetical protein